MKRLAFLFALVALAVEARPPSCDLGAYRETLAKYAATEADAKASAPAKARAKMSRLVLEMQTCEDAELQAKIAETRAFIERGGGLSVPDEKVEFLLRVADAGGVFELPDVEKLAEAAAKGDAKATNRYIDLMLRRCRPGPKDFTYARSYDRLLDIVDAALKDPVMEKSRANLEGKRFGLLRSLGRTEEAVAYANAKIAAAKDNGTKRRWYQALAGAYREDARRYAEKPSPALVGKSEEMIVKSAAFAKGGLTADDCLAIAELRLSIDDFGGAKEFAVKAGGLKPNAKQIRRGEKILGEAAYGLEAWSEAADHYLRLFNPKDRNDHDLTVRTVQALFAADRRGDALPLAQWLAEEKGGRYRQSREQFARLAKEIEGEGKWSLLGF